MVHFFEKPFFEIAKRIISENKSPELWAEIESSDMFQDGNYVGGFDATEMEFTFSVFLDGIEYWFQLPLSAIEKIYKQELNNVEIRLTDK